MCQNQRWIKNPYTQRMIYVKCGVCPACLQEKAGRRVARIQNTRFDNDGLVSIFGSLTYTNESIPYLDRKEFIDFCKGLSSKLCVYRDSILTPHGLVNQKNIVKVYDKDDFEGWEKFTEHEKLLGLRYKEDGIYKEDFERVGVSIYSDVQNFIKRFRQELGKFLDPSVKWNYFMCSEYGENYHRPHFHIQLFFPKGFESIFKHAFFKSWPFHDISKVRPEEVYQYARKPAKYISSYLNCFTHIPSLFTTKVFKPKCSYSYGLGFGSKNFSYDEVSKKISERNLRYDKTFVYDGCITTINVPLPKYVINRYFYKPKGFSNLSADEVYDLILSRGRRITYDLGYKMGLSSSFMSEDKTFSKRSKIIDELRKWEKFIYKNTFRFGKTQSDLEKYAYNYANVWNIYQSNVLVDSYRIYEQLSERDKIEFYFNVSDFFENRVRSPTLEYLAETEFDCEKDFNKSHQNLLQDLLLRQQFVKYDKSRKLNSRYYRL